MGIPGLAVQPVGEGNSGSAVQFLIEWVSDGEAKARAYRAGHAEPDGASLIATDGADVIGYVAIARQSGYADSAAAAFRWFTRSRWPGRPGGGAWRQC